MNKNPEMQGNDETNQQTQPTESVVEESAVVVEQGRPVPVDPSEKLIVTEATLETELPDGTTMQTTLVPKKKSKGIIAAIVAVTLLILAGIGVAVWYFAYYSNPQKVAYDAISGLLTEKTFVSELVMTTDEGKIWVNTSNVDASASTDVTFLIEPTDANGESLTDNAYKFSLNNIIISDGVIYIKTEDVAKAFEQFADDYGLASGQLSDLVAVVSGIFETVDGEWWRISVPEVLDTVMAGDSKLQPTKEFYACLVDVANQDLKGEVAKIYKDNRFIQVVKSREASSIARHSLYDVSFDYDKMAGFTNAVPETEAAKGVYDCYNHYMRQIGEADRQISAEDIPEATADELREDYSDLPTIQMDIEDFSHQLSAITVKDIESSSLSLSIGFKHGEHVEINAPDSYRPITELYEDIEDIITEILISQDGYDPALDDIYDTDLDEYDWSA